MSLQTSVVSIGWSRRSIFRDPLRINIMSILFLVSLCFYPLDECAFEHVHLANVRAFPTRHSAVTQTNFCPSTLPEILLVSRVPSHYPAQFSIARLSINHCAQRISHFIYELMKKNYPPPCNHTI